MIVIKYPHFEIIWGSTNILHHRMILGILGYLTYAWLIMFKMLTLLGVVWFSLGA